MPRLITINGIVDDGSQPVVFIPPAQGETVTAAYGESLTVHLILRYPSGRQIVATPQRVVNFGARTKPLPEGQLLFQHLGVVSPLGDGGWDCPIVAADYRLVLAGVGRFLLDFWLTDNTITPPPSNPVQALAAFVVTPSAISTTGPVTSPTPNSVVGYGLPPAGASGALLVAQGATGYVSAVAWSSNPQLDAVNLTHETFVRTEIWVSPTGSDITGNGGTGSAGIAFKTWQRAVDSVPVAQRNRSYVIRGDGMSGTEQVSVPPYLAGEVESRIINGINFKQFRNESYLTLQAIPIIKATLNAATTTQAVDAYTGLHTFTDTSQNWTVDQWKGLCLIGNGPGSVAAAAIQGNTSNTLTVAASQTYTAPLQIVDYGATINAPSFLYAIQAVGSRLSVNGIRVVGNTLCANTGSMDATIASFSGLVVVGNGASWFNTWVAVYYTGVASIHTDVEFYGPVSIQRSVLFNAAPTFGAADSSINGSILDNSYIMPQEFVFSPLLLNGVQFFKQGLVLYPKSCIKIDIGIRVDNAVPTSQNIQGSGIVLYQNSVCRFNNHGNLGGTGNAGYGIELLQGSTVALQTGELHTITGTLGDIKVDQLPVRSWTDLATNHPIGIQRDLLHTGATLILSAFYNVNQDQVPQLYTYTTATRPGATAVATGAMIGNLSTHALNWSDGLHWYDGVGATAVS